MKLTFEKTDKVAEGIWLAEINSNDLKQLNGGSNRRGGRSVVMLDNINIIDSGVLSAPISGAFVLNRGDTKEAIIISGDKSRLSDVAPSKIKEYEIDRPFIEFCQEHHLPNQIIQVAQKLLEGVRLKHPNDELILGQNNKWIMRPNNFLTITPQVRNKVLRISVRNSVECDTVRTIEWKSGMPGYREFILDNDDQIQDAILVALASVNKGR